MLSELLTFYSREPSPAFLFNSPNGPFLVDFFWQSWKASDVVELTQTDLETALRRYKSFLEDAHPGKLTASIADDIAMWVKNGLVVRRYVDANLDEPVYQLSPATEDVLSFFGRLFQRERSFVGTGSRLHQILKLLDDLSTEASPDRDVRLESLYEKRRAIDAEIAQFESGEPMPTLRPEQTRERFQLAVSILQSLQGDFRTVESSFLRIARDIQARQFDGTGTRGEILADALDAEDALKNSGEGLSFFAFIDLVLNPRQTDRMEAIVERVLALSELSSLTEDCRAVRMMGQTLAGEAETVTRTIRRLSGTLRRLLDQSTSDERRRVADVLGRLRTALVNRANASRDDQGLESIALELETNASIESPARYRWWSPSAVFDSVPLQEHEVDPEKAEAAARNYRQMAHLNWTEMQSRLDRAAGLDADWTLKDLIEHEPPEYGTVEVLGYVQLAKEGGHEFDPLAMETLNIPSSDELDTRIEMQIPRITLVSAERRAPVDESQITAEDNS